MKYLSKIIFITILTLTITSCNEEEFNSDTDNQNANISTLNDVLKKQTIKNKFQSKSKNTLDEDGAKEMLNPIIQETVSVLRNGGISKNEIISEFGSLNSPEIAIVGLALLTENRKLSMSSPYAFKEASVLDCAARAFVGMELHEGFWSSFTNRRVLLRAVGKLATRTLGFIGAALIVYDFADCMWGE